jgi:hypothetical protein
MFAFVRSTSEEKVPHDLLQQSQVIKNDHVDVKLKRFSPFQISQPRGGRIQMRKSCNE